MTEFDVVEDYRKKALRIELKSQRILDKAAVKQSISSSSASNDSNLNNSISQAASPRLPEIEIYKFSGDLKTGLHFGTNFKLFMKTKT